MSKLNAQRGAKTPACIEVQVSSSRMLKKLHDHKIDLVAGALFHEAGISRTYKAIAVCALLGSFPTCVLLIDTKAQTCTCQSKSRAVAVHLFAFSSVSEFGEVRRPSKMWKRGN